MNDERIMSKKDALFYKVIETENLKKAWKHVYSKSKTSLSLDVRESAMAFNADHKNLLEKITSELINDTFLFNWTLD